MEAVEKWKGLAHAQPLKVKLNSYPDVKILNADYSKRLHHYLQKPFAFHGKGWNNFGVSLPFKLQQHPGIHLKTGKYVAALWGKAGFQSQLSNPYLFDDDLIVPDGDPVKLIVNTHPKIDLTSGVYLFDIEGQDVPVTGGQKKPADVFLKAVVQPRRRGNLASRLTSAIRSMDGKLAKEIVSYTKTAEKRFDRPLTPSDLRWTGLSCAQSETALRIIGSS